MKDRLLDVLEYAIPFAIVLIFAVVAALVTSCGVCKLEYHVDGQWQKCNWIAAESCGLTLRCGDVVHYCQTDAASRCSK